MKTTILRIKTRLRLPLASAAFALLELAVVCCGSPQVGQAVTPAPDGAYPGGNTAEGQAALLSLTTGTYNTAVGLFSLTSNTEGNFNTGIGAGALLASTGDENTATGAGALLSNTASGNTANGAFALFTNIVGQNNTATGNVALFFNNGSETNNEGSENSAFGTAALFSNTTGFANSAFGSGAMGSNNSGSFNTAAGYLALDGSFALGEGSVVTGSNNTAVGAFSLASNIEGGINTAVGLEALFNNTNGESNTGIGAAALSGNTSGFSNTAIGHQALDNNSTGSGNIGIGENAGFNVMTASNVICIGGIGGENIDNSCYIANIYSNIQPVIGTDPDYVTISSNGRLGRSNLNGSSRRFKHDIHPIDKASEVIFALKPVRFRYNKEYDSSERLSFGLIAEDVVEVAPDLVGRNKRGAPESVRYEQINAMLLNEFLKEHRKVQELQAAVAQQHHDFEMRITELKREIESVVTRSKQQDAKIQKVSADVELDKAGAQAVVNN